MAMPMRRRPAADDDAAPAARSRAGAGDPRAPRSAWDTCQPGVALRSLLFVHGVLALGLALAAPGWGWWLANLGLAVAVGLPATLAWLAAVCGLQMRLVTWSPPALWAGLAGLGAACASGVALPLAVVGLITLPGPAWLALPLAGAALAAAITHWLLQRARLQLPASTQARLDELQSRIRPHFLFNALNSAVALVREDPPRAEEVLEDLAELFRAALVGSGTQASVGDEVALARRYLAIEQVRFGERLKVSWQIDDRALAAPVPSLVLQPLVENAVKHGVEPAVAGGTVQIRVQAYKGQALVSITNSLPETPAAAAVKGQGIALRNVRERLQLLHDLTMRFEAGEIEGRRYRVRIAVPLPSGEAPVARRARPVGEGAVAGAERQGNRPFSTLPGPFEGHLDGRLDARHSGSQAG